MAAGPIAERNQGMKKFNITKLLKFYDSVFLSKIMIMVSKFQKVSYYYR